MKFISLFFLFFLSQTSYSTQKYWPTYPNSVNRSKSTEVRPTQLALEVPHDLDQRQWKTSSTNVIPAYTMYEGRLVSIGNIPANTAVKPIAFDAINGVHFYQIEKPSNISLNKNANPKEIWISGMNVEEGK